MGQEDTTVCLFCDNAELEDLRTALELSEEKSEILRGRIQQMMSQ